MDDNNNDKKDTINENQNPLMYSYSVNYSYVKTTFGKRLLQLRKEKGLSQDDLSKSLGISRVALSYYERGERTADIEFLIKAANLFKVSPNYLLSEGARKEENDSLSLYNVFCEEVADFLVADHHRIGFLNEILSHKDMDKVADLIRMTHYKPLVNEYEINYFSFMLSQLLYSIIVDVGKDAYEFKALANEEKQEILTAIEDYRKKEKEYKKKLDNPITLTVEDKLPNTEYDVRTDMYDADNWWLSVETMSEELCNIYSKVQSLLNK